jgi:hypothetical protein
VETRPSEAYCFRNEEHEPRPAAVVACLALVGGVAYATIPDANGVIHGCYKKSGGAVRVIDSPSASCDSNETPLNWSQTGPQGPQGEPGLSGYEVVEGEPFDADPGTVGLLAICPAGKKPLGGGFSATNGDVNLYESRPLPAVNAWQVSLFLDGISAIITPYVVCAYVAD